MGCQCSVWVEVALSPGSNTIAVAVAVAVEEAAIEGRRPGGHLGVEGGDR